MKREGSGEVYSNDGYSREKKGSERGEIYCGIHNFQGKRIIMQRKGRFKVK